MKKSYKIIFLGNTSVGKTMLIYRYISDGFTMPEPTIGIDFFSNTLDVNGQQVRLQLWDTAGQERYKSIITPYIRDSFLGIIVYAINDRESFKQLKYWIETYQSKNNKNVRILIVANKRDLRTTSGETSVGEENLVSDEEGREFAEKVNAKFCTSSALEKKDILDLSEEIKNEIAADLESNPEIEDDTDALNLLQAKHTNKWCC
ncbi:hypothetical protein NUSPORA_01133 [Nucleospora cyclopteri]